MDGTETRFLLLCLVTIIIPFPFLYPSPLLSLLSPNGYNIGFVSFRFMHQFFPGFGFLDAVPLNLHMSCEK